MAALTFADHCSLVWKVGEDRAFVGPTRQGSYRRLRSSWPAGSRARERAILAGDAARFEAAWAVDGPRTRSRRWRARLLASG
jgi:hypothetical protein